MSRLSIVTKDKAQIAVESMYKDLERRITASPPGLCPIELTSAFVKMSLAQSCGKCVPCRVGLKQLSELMDDVLDDKADLDTIDTIEATAEDIYLSSDCAIGYEAGSMVLDGLRGFREDFIEHVTNHRCISTSNHNVPCVALCPAGVDIPGYIAMVREGRYADAVRLIRKDNPMPTVCALICEHPCENRCKRGMVDYPVNIRAMKKAAVDNAGIVPVPEREPSTGKRVAIVGGGPGGLSAAYYLSLMGHAVTVYEQRKRLGGMLRYGIPNYRLPRERLDADIDAILSTGVEVHTEVSIGKDITMAQLRERYDAVYISIGAHTDKKIGLPGEDEAIGITSAVEMLRGIGDDEMPDYHGLDVVVVGGGNVAMDVARSSIRLGAKSVRIVYRRRRHDMTALPAEIDGAIAEGCELLELMAPTAIETDEAHHVKSLVVQPQIISEIRGGRPSVRDAEGGPVHLGCDLIVVAIGQGIESKSFEDFGIPVRRGAIEALDTSGVRDLDGVFAGGDCVTGPATVIRAIAAGKVAAANIDEYLGYHHEIRSDVEIPSVSFEDRKRCGRVEVPEREAGERKDDFEPIEKELSCAEICQEAGRCLRCDHFGYGAFRGGRVETW